MNNLILHIGMPKTGSTSIQNTFLANRELLGEFGIYIPKKGLDSSGACWPIIYNMNFQRQKGFYIEEYVKDGLLEEFKNEVATVKNKDILLSCEDLYYYEEDFIESFLALLPPFKKLKLVIYIRAADKYEESAINQITKNYAGRWASLETFVDKKLTGKTPILEHLTKWEKFSDDVEIIVKPFHLKSLFEKDVSRDFMKTILASEEQYKAINYVSSKSNEGLYDFEALCIKNFINQLPLELSVIRSFLKPLNEWSEARGVERKDILSREQKKLALSKMTPEYKTIEQRYGADLSILYQDASNENKKVSDTETNTFSPDSLFEFISFLSENKEFQEQVQSLRSAIYDSVRASFDDIIRPESIEKDKVGSQQFKPLQRS